MENNMLTSDGEKLQKVVKYTGGGLVLAGASVAVMVVGTSVIAAATIGVTALFMLNFVVPVAARTIAVWRQNALTAITEKFSEETIREDEEKEGERIKLLEKQYTVSRSELEGVQEELNGQMGHANADEKQLIKAQVESIQDVIDNAEETLRTRKSDFTELQRVNKLYIALHRSADAMEKVHGAERNPQELQRIETARTAIKTKMRAALAGKTIEAMNVNANKPPELLGVVTSMSEHTTKVKKMSS